MSSSQHPETRSATGLDAPAPADPRVLPHGPVVHAPPRVRARRVPAAVRLGPVEPGQPAGPTLGEALVLGAVLVVALVAWAGLALAQVSFWSLPAVLAAAAAGLALAAVAVVVVRPRTRLVVDRRELAALAVLAVVAGIMLFPGATYGIGDKDPGTYVSHGISIARTGSTRVADPVLDRTRVSGFQPSSPGARLPGLWYQSPDDGQVTVQFYHLWPSALAAAWSIGGRAALVNLNPLLGVLAILAAALAARRAFNPAAGALAGVLLALNMLQVWQAKYQSAEIITQAFLLAALLAFLVAVRTGWRPAAGLAGLLVGIAWLARGDTLLLVLIAAAVGCALIVLRRGGRTAAWFAGGLALVTPHALLQAYGTAAEYTLANGIPPLPVTGGLVAGGLLGALVLRSAARPLWARLDGLLGDRTAQRWAGLAVTALAGLLLVIGFLRPWLFGVAWFNYNGVLTRSYDEQTMRRLSWFFTLPGIGLALLGVAVVTLRRWRAAAWAVVLPVLLVFPVYAVAAENSSRLMWWNRRFVPVVVPGLLILIAVALVALLTWDGTLPWLRGRAAALARRARPGVRVLGGVLALFLVVSFAVQSVPLRGHREYDGSFEVGDRIAAVAGGRQGVFLFGRGPGVSPTVFAVPVWLQHGQVAVLLRVKPSPAYVRAYARGFAGSPVFLVVQGGERPAGYEEIGLRRVERITTALPMWDESDTVRPAGAHDVPVDLSVWLVEGTEPPSRR
jgi:hypothetical protein